MEARHQVIALAGVMLILVACEAQNAPPETHPQWVIHSKVVFKESDLTTAREALPLGAFRLTFPYVAGDLYGSPTIGDLMHLNLNPDYTFEIDLNRTQADLLKSLQPTEFSYDYLKIDPPEARIARLTPLALQADGIEQVATTDWVDTRSNERLMLVYVDRPARITGALTRNGRTTRYNIRISKAGYVWIGCVETEDEEQMFTEVERPENVILALTPRQTSGELPRSLPGHDSAHADSAHADSAHADSAHADSASSSAASSASTPQTTSDLRGLDALSSSADLRGVDSPRRAASRARTAALPDR